MSEPAELRDDWQRPHPRRLSREHHSYDEILQRHARSVDERRPTYMDPVSGFSVFTAAFLAGRRYCCESGCRHCPYLAAD